MALQSCFCLVFVAIMLTVQLHCVMGEVFPDIQDLRLNGSLSPNEGRVEVLVNGSWYAVCRNHWGDHETNTACRQLRYPSGGRRISNKQAMDRGITEGNLDFLLEEFDCENDKSEPMILILSNCEREKIDSCNSEAAKVICEGTKLTTTTVTVLPSSSPEAPTQGPNEITQSSITTDSEVNGQTSNSRKRSQQFPTAVVAAVVGTVLGLLLLLAVLLVFFCRRSARSQEDNMTSKLKEDTDQVGMGELGIAQHDDSEKTYHTIQDPAVPSKVLPVIPTAPPSEHDENYSTIPDVQSSPTGGRVDERAPAPPPSHTDVYYSVVRDNGAASPADQTGTSGTATTTQEPEYAVVKKASKRKENKKEESGQGTGAPGPEYAVVNKNHKKDAKTEGQKGDNQSGTVDNVIYERY